MLTEKCFGTKFLQAATVTLSSISCFGDISWLKWIYMFFLNIDVLFSLTINRFSFFQWLFFHSGAGTSAFASIDKQTYMNSTYLRCVYMCVCVLYKKGRKSIEASNFERDPRKKEREFKRLNLVYRHNSVFFSLTYSIVMLTYLIRSSKVFKHIHVTWYIHAEI